MEIHLGIQDTLALSTYVIEYIRVQFFNVDGGETLGMHVGLAYDKGHK